VVAGQNPEAARVDRKAFGDAELEREVADNQRSLGVHEARIAFVVIAPSRARPRQGGLHVGALTGARHTGLAELAQQKDGILPRRFPQFGVESAEQILDERLPGPDQIESELF